MPGQARIGDNALGIDKHRCPKCLHVVSGPATQGSPDVFVNGLPAVRNKDCGIHAVCCGSNTWNANGGSPTVFINDEMAFRILDPTEHCGGVGIQVVGSGNVFTGNSSAAGLKNASETHAPFICDCN